MSAQEIDVSTPAGKVAMIGVMLMLCGGLMVVAFAVIVGLIATGAIS